MQKDAECTAGMHSRCGDTHAHHNQATHENSCKARITIESRPWAACFKPEAPTPLYWAAAGPPSTDSFSVRCHSNRRINVHPFFSIVANKGSLLGEGGPAAAWVWPAASLSGRSLSLGASKARTSHRLGPASMYARSGGCEAATLLGPLRPMRSTGSRPASKPSCSWRCC